MITYRKLRNKLKEDFGAPTNGVAGVAGIGVAVNNDQKQAEPGGKSAKITLLKRKKRAT